MGELIQFPGAQPEHLSVYAQELNSTDIEAYLEMNKELSETRDVDTICDLIDQQLILSERIENRSQAVGVGKLIVGLANSPAK